MRSNPPPFTMKQHGAVLMVMLVVMILGVATILVTSLNSTALKNSQQKSTEVILAQAKEALIGYAITYGDTHADTAHGYLPCPDIDGSNGEGSSKLSCGSKGANTVGRLPWRTLDLPTLFDSSGECLWYAVSGNYKSNPKADITMNWDNEGQLQVYGSDGNEILAKEVVAVVIAPGAVSASTQNRADTATPSVTPVCGGNYTASAYLDNDTTHNINNADIATGKFILPHEHRDANGNVSILNNDQLIYITRQDIWTGIQKRIAREAKQCLDDYAATSNGKYPWAVPIDTPTNFSPLIMGENNTLFGRLPTRPNIQTEDTPSDIVEMQEKFAELWVALAVFKADKTEENLDVMRDKADDAEDAADDVENNYDDTALEDPADDLKDAADDAKDDLNTSSSNGDITDIQDDIIDAANDFVDEMTSEFSQASGMESVWPASCTLFSSEHWANWKNLIFYQIAGTFKPDGGASCGDCLSITGSGHNVPDSGSYHAAIIMAGKKLSSNRTTDTIGDYLETENQLPSNDNTKPYKTYRVTDTDYKANNDFVLCLDGEVNCQ